MVISGERGVMNGKFFNCPIELLSVEECDATEAK